MLRDNIKFESGNFSSSVFTGQIIGASQYVLYKEPWHDQSINKKDNMATIDFSMKASIFLEVSKPWGSYYETFRAEDNSVVTKIITVDPKKRISLQSHKDREEFWVIVSGTGIVDYQDVEPQNPYFFSVETYRPIVDMVKRVKPLDTITVKKGKKHRITNDTNEPLIIAETQYGVCDEEDITRYEDDYGRDAKTS